MFALRIDDDLELRLLERRHAPELFELTVANREHLRPYLPWVPKMTLLEQTEGFIDNALQQFARHDGFQAGIFVHGELVGMVGLHYIRWHTERTEVGYWLAERAQGQGVMTRAIGGLVAYCFRDLHLGRVEIRCAEENTRSRRIPERLGFTQEGILRRMNRLEGGWCNWVVYGLLRDEWRG